MELISLTGPGSHRLKRETGVGSCSLGGPGADLQVAPDAVVDWGAFDSFATPAGSLWPRWIDYEGDDTGWLAWSRRRPIEGFTWSPHSAHDVDASRAGGKPLRTQLRRDTREWRNSSVSKLRTPEWFATEYRLPFAAWPPKSSRAAVKAFRAAETAIAAATTEAAIDQAVRAFVTAVNRLPRIETTEREDAQAAVALLTTETPLGDLSKPADGWFDTTREF